MKHTWLLAALSISLVVPGCADSDTKPAGKSSLEKETALNNSASQPVQPANHAESASESVESVQEKILALRGRIKSFTANIDVKFDSSQGESWVKSHTYGPMAYLFQGDKQLYRIDMKIDTSRVASGAEEKTVETQTLMSDGDYMYQLGTEGGHKKAIKARIDKLQSSVPSPEFFFYLQRDYNLSLMPDEEVDGKDCWVIRAAKISEEEVLQLKTITYFRKDIPLMVKTVNLDRFDNVMQVTRIKDVQIDVPVDPKQFEFKPDPDYELQDQTIW